MNKLFKLAVITFAVVGVFSTVDAHSSFNYPSTFFLEVEEDVYIANYQNMRIELLKTGFGECDSSTSPCPLGNPSNGKRSATIQVTTEGGCGPGADSRCLGAPAYFQTFTVKDGSSVKALGLNIKAFDIKENGLMLSVSLSNSEDDSNDGLDDTVVSPLPLPSESPKKIIPVGVVTGGQGTIRKVEKIIVCPNGEESENCSVCEKGECRPETTPASPRKLGEPISSTNPPVMKLKNDETLVSAIRVESSGTSTVNLYEVKAKRNARILFLFPVSPEITYTVSASGTSTVSARPWWNFLAW